MSSLDSRTPAGRSRPSTARILRIAVLVLLVVVVVAAASLAASPIGQRFVEDADAAPPVTGVDTVPIADSRFVEASVAVPVGTTVTWEWTDGEEHNVVFDDGESSPLLASGTWSRTFDEPGEHSYTCTLHLFMDGRVVVTE